MNPVFRREFRKILFCQRRRRIGLSTSTGAGEAKNEESQSFSLRQNGEQVSTGDHRTPQEMGER